MQGENDQDTRQYTNLYLIIQNFPILYSTDTDIIWNSTK